MLVYWYNWSLSRLIYLPTPSLICIFFCTFTGNVLLNVSSFVNIFCIYTSTRVGRVANHYKERGSHESASLATPSDVGGNSELSN